MAWIEIGSRPEDFTPVPYETTIDYWKHLHTVIEAEPPYEAYRMYYGELAALGVEKGKAALRLLFELKGKTGSSVDLYFGPTAPAGHEGEWIKTIPGKGWFVYFRIYGPETPAFDGSWKPGDFELVK